MRLSLRVLAFPTLVESDNSVTSNQLLIIRMSSYTAHMSNTEIIKPPTNVARLTVYSFLSSTCFLFIATIFFVFFIFNSEK